MEGSNVSQIRGLWEATRSGGVEGALRLTDPDVQWEPHAAGGRVFSTAQLLEWLESFEGDRAILDARAYSYQVAGNRVLASGSFRLTGSGGDLTDHQIHWVSEFSDDGRLLRAKSYATLSEAERALAQSESVIRS